MKKVNVIIQARSDSSRLHRKAFENLGSKPMLWHVIERAKRCKKIDEVIVATTIKPEDREIVDIASMCQVRAFTGSEDNVLKRYYDAAKKFKSGVIIRMTGDCPLIHPPTVDAMIELLLEKQVEYVCPDPRHRSLETGVEVFTMEALEKIHKKAFKDYQREHVTLYLREYPEEFPIALYTPNPLFQRKDIRLTVDYPEDLELVRHLYHKFYCEGDIIDIMDVVNYLDQHPEKKNSNSHVCLSQANQLSISDKISEKIIKQSESGV